MSEEIDDTELIELGVDEFCFEHLPEHLQEVSKPYAEHARRLANVGRLMEQPNRQRDIALHYLLLSKDAAVRMRVMEQRHRQ